MDACDNLLSPTTKWTGPMLYKQRLASDQRSIREFLKKRRKLKIYYLFLLVCLEFFVPLGNFSLIWRRHLYRWRAANVDLCLALMAIEQRGFFSVQHLLWHGKSVYNGHLRRPLKLTPTAKHLSVEQSLSVF